MRTTAPGTRVPRKRHSRIAVGRRLGRTSRPARSLQARLAPAATQQGRAGVRRPVPADRDPVPAGTGVLEYVAHTGPNDEHVVTALNPSASRSGRHGTQVLPRRRQQRPRRRGAAALRRAQLALHRRRGDADHDRARDDPRHSRGLLPRHRRRLPVALLRAAVGLSGACSGSRSASASRSAASPSDCSRSAAARCWCPR